MGQVYGVISDVHHNPKFVKRAIDVLKDLGARMLIVAGDISRPMKTVEDEFAYTGYIVKALGDSGLESYIIPGCCDKIGPLASSIAYFKDKYKNIIDCVSIAKVQSKDHELVFLPGADFSLDGEYLFGTNPMMSTGRYALSDGGYEEFPGWSEYNKRKNEGTAYGVMHYTNLHEMEKYVTDPERTVLVSHVPPFCNWVDNRIDEGYYCPSRFASNPDSMYFDVELINLERKVEQDDLERVSEKYKIAIETKSGSRGLRSACEHLGLSKCVSGHFHYSGHRAHGPWGEQVKEGEWSDSLYWNVGQLDIGQCGLLFVKDDKMTYHNVLLQQHTNFLGKK